MATSLQDLNYASDSDIWAVLEVPVLDPNVEVSNNVSGTNTVGTSKVTVVRAPNDTLVSAPGYAVDLYDFYEDYPIDSDGTTPDVEIRFAVGEIDVARTIISGGKSRILFPRADKLVGGPERRVPYAQSMRKLYNLMQKGANVPNLALQILGIKIPSQEPLKVYFRSTTGWGNNGTAIRPLRLYLKADMWTRNELARFQSMYNGSFAIRRHPNGEIAGAHQLTQALTDSTINILPNGTDQKHSTQIYRKIVYAQNNQAINTSSPYIFSNLPAVGGQQNNVTNVHHDLGFPYENTPKAFIPYELGMNFVQSLLGKGSNPQIYVGWYKSAERTILPNMYTNGLLVTGQRNPFQYGAAAPQLTTGDVIFPMASAAKLINLLIQGENWAPAVSAVGLSDLAANSVTVLLGGIEVIPQ